MRKTAGKAALEPITFGDPQLADVLVRALDARSDVDRLTHGFHTYPAGLHPDAAALLVSAFPGDSVLDPFCGGGTVLVEARVAGRRAVGRDIGPVALRVARARTATPDDATLTRFRSTARRLAAEAREATQLPPDRILRVVREWYAPHALRELESLRRGVLAADPEVRPLLECVLSSILVKVSWRRSDTSAQRVKHHRPPGTTAVLFHKKARELGRRLEALRAAVPPGTPPADVALADARTVRVDPVDLALTSPPYPSTYDYLPMQHLRNVWFGDGGREDAEIGPRRDWRRGAREARRAWIADTDAWTAAVAACLRPGGHLVVVIGDGLTPTGFVDTSEPTESAARKAGLVSVARATVDRLDHARGAVRPEHVFAFRKPG